MRFILMLGAATLVAPALAAAQASVIPDWPIAAGSRVRILSPVLGRTVQTGSIVSATSDTLVFRRGAQSTSTPIGTPSIVTIDVAQRTHTRKLTGGVLGLAIGAGVGAIIGDVTYKPCTNCFDIFGRSGNVVAGSILGGLAGTLTGVIVGNRQFDNWVPVTVPRQ
jgi:hypothetical protein